MITPLGRRVRAVGICVGLALLALITGYTTGDRCYPTFSAGSCFAMIDAQVAK